MLEVRFAVWKINAEGVEHEVLIGLGGPFTYVARTIIEVHTMVWTLSKTAGTARGCEWTFVCSG